MKIVVLGASAGGGALIEEIVQGLHRGCKGAVVVAIHMKPAFIDDLVRHLSSRCELPVHKATDTTLKEGHLYICDSQSDIVYTRFGTSERLESQRIVDSLYKPNIDILLGSFMAKKDLNNLFVALLSGIGRDGVQGMKLLRQTQAHTYACDAQSAVVFGMPKVAIEEGACKQSGDLELLKKRIAEFLG